MIPELPANVITGLDRRLVSSVSVITSPFTGTQEVQDWGGEWWEYEVRVAILTPREGKRVAAFFAALGGARGRFIFRDPTSSAETSVGAGVVFGSNQSGAVLISAGWLPQTLVFEAGDLFSLGFEDQTCLYQLTADVMSDTAGVARLPIVPKLRFSPVDGEAIERAAPKVLLRLSEPVATQVGRAGKYQFSFRAREAR